MADTLEQINHDISICQRCELRASATQPVPGLGQGNLKYYILGEAPGRNEDEVGMPFVGLAGQRLDRLIRLAKIDPNDCYLSNVCRCRPPDNRTPKKKEIKLCSDFVWRELKILRPETVITLGATPLSLFKPDVGVSQVHGTSFEFELKEEE